VILALASGKGGTGKTTLAVALALCAKEKVCFLDCDVEAPNAHFFLPVTEVAEEEVSVLVPEVDDGLCDHCGICAKFCRFGALAVMPKKTLIFEELCHGCGGCVKVCPRKALREKAHVVGKISSGRSGRIEFHQGRLRVGVPMAPPIIRALRKKASPDHTVVIDGPPGAACSLMVATQGADFVLLVAEPTPFGVHDLEIAAAAIRSRGLLCGVAINRSGSRDELLENFCRKENLPVLIRIRESARIAEAGARGHTLLDARPELRPEFEALWKSLQKIKASHP